MKLSPMTALQRSLAVTLGLIGTALLSLTARAGFTEFSATGTSAEVPVTSTASFDTSSGFLIVTLENTTPHTADAAQLLTGIRFKLSPDLLTPATLADATAVPRNIAEDGTYTDGASVNILGTWEAGFSGGVYQLDFNPTAEFAIVGPADGETTSTPGVYTANGSINGNDGHNPFTAKTATFKFSNPAFTADTTITDVSFIYNTALSNVIPGTPNTKEAGSPVPEPATMGFGLAILAVCGASRRRPVVS
jgi:hypothetical protein